jgi:hypothetical protein
MKKLNTQQGRWGAERALLTHEEHLPLTREMAARTLLEEGLLGAAVVTMAFFGVMVGACG